MAISVRASGTWAASITQSPSVAIPAGYSAGDLGILVSAWRPYTVTATVNQSWTEIIDESPGATANGNGTGSSRVYVAYKVFTTASETNPTITRSAAITPEGDVIIVLQKAASDGDWTVTKIATAVEQAMGTTAMSHALTTTAGILANDLVFALTAVADDSATFTRATTAISGGPTWSGNVVEYPATHLSDVSGNDMAADLIYRVASSYVATGQTITITATLSAAERVASTLFSVRVGRTGSFTADAVLKKTITPSFTADATLRIGRSGSFTADAVLRKTASGSFTADAVLFKTLSGSFTANAILRRTQTGTFTADAVIARLVFSDDFNRTVATGWGTSSDGYKWPSTQPTLGSVDGATGIGSASANYDVWVLPVPSVRAVQFDFLVPASPSEVYIFTVIGHLSNSGNDVLPYDDGGSWYLIVQDASSASRQVSLIDEFPTPAVGPQAGEWWSVRFTHDNAGTPASGVLWKVGTTRPYPLQFTAGGASHGLSTIPWLSLRLRGLAGGFTPQVDNFQVWDMSGQLSAGGWLLIDAVIKRTQSGSLTADSILAKTATGTFSVDAVITKTVESSLAADAILQTTSAVSLTTDALLLRTQASSFTVDAVLAVGTVTVGSSFTADAVLRVEQAGSFAADAAVKRTMASIFSADAVLLRVASASFTANATVKRTQAGSMTANAVIKAAVSGSATADAIRLRTFRFGQGVW